MLGHQPHNFWFLVKNGYDKKMINHIFVWVNKLAYSKT